MTTSHSDSKIASFCEETRQDILTNMSQLKANRGVTNTDERLISSAKPVHV